MGTIYFQATDGVNGRELWKSDGTETGTVMVKDIHPTMGSNPDHMTPVGNTLFFSANNGVEGTELWKTDGTESGTVMVRNIYPTFNSDPNEFINHLNTLYFQANDGTHGRELWQSDGTEAGTYMIAQINPIGNSDLDYLTVVDNTLFFQANDGVRGHELWKLDGSTRIPDLLAEDSHLLLYPNPSTGRFTLEFENAWQGIVQCKIIDFSGSVVQIRHFLKTQAYFQSELNQTDLPTGIYFVILSHKDETMTTSILIQ